ncbi:hypothetical protein F5Y12DRAFT_791210 [Xylaria sp. FL1777]|nr:hypothetical protein F5Y12DRAFT_791210 [Xylaria sp. FL1777]
MNSDPQWHPASAPAGDIGYHVFPKLIIVLSGIVGLFAVATRLFTRYKIKKLGIPDLLLVISTGLFIAILYNGYEAAIYPGFGVHTWQFDPKLATASHFSYKSGTITFGLGIAFLKVAILLDWVQIFVPTGVRNTLFWILHLLIFSNALFYLIGTFIDGFVCPSRDVGTVKCNTDIVRYIVASGVINVISDLTIFITPHWVIWKLNMSESQKRGISVLFMIGLCALARLLYVLKAYHTRDVLYYSVIINMWAIAEQTLGFLVIGVPAIPKAFGEFHWTKRLGLFSRSRSAPTSNPTDYYERGATWPLSPQRRHRDPWDTDTRALVMGEEAMYITLPDQAHMPEDHGRRSSRDESEVVVTICYKE